MAKSNNVVSVVVPTYNHEPYISQCLDGILCQETDFDFEVLVGEDDSRDRTRSICKGYAERYPGKIRLFLNDRKDVIHINGRPTGRGNLINLLRHADGKYVALCEGDDYWTSRYKLQKQVSFLETHPECAISFHNCEEFYDDASKESWLYCPPGQKEIATLEDLLFRCNFIPTCSVMFRNRLFNDFPEWYRSIPIGDWPLHVLNAQFGSVGYMNEVMSRHRHHVGGIWSLRSQVQNILDVIQAYETVNAHFNGKYDRIIEARIADYYYDLFRIYREGGEKEKASNYLSAAVRISLPSIKMTMKYIIGSFQLLKMNTAHERKEGNPNGR